MLQRRLGLGDRRLAPRLVAGRVRERADPFAADACASTIGACTECSSSRVSDEPLGELRRRRRVAVVEVGAGGEQLDRLEAVRGDMHEVLARQPLLVEEVCRDAEATVGHAP